MDGTAHLEFEGPFFTFFVPMFFFRALLFCLQYFLGPVWVVGWVALSSAKKKKEGKAKRKKWNKEQQRPHEGEVHWK